MHDYRMGGVGALNGSGALGYAKHKTWRFQSEASKLFQLALQFEDSGKPRLASEALKLAAENEFEANVWAAVTKLLKASDLVGAMTLITRSETR